MNASWLIKRLLILLGIAAIFLIPFIPKDSFASLSSGLSPSLSPGASPDTSLNWAGYNAVGGAYTSITGTWTVPSVTGTVPSADATWVGIGGVTKRDLIQGGTQAIIDRTGISYQAWYEALPGDSITIPLDVNPGDSVTVTISQATYGTWNLSFMNNTTGKSYSQSLQYYSSLSSAEWIEEMLSTNRDQFIPLDKFGQVNISGSVVKNGQSMTMAQAGATPVTMTSGSLVLATPSALTSGGSAFTVTRSSAQSVLSFPGSRRSRRSFFSPFSWNDYVRMMRGF